MQGGFDARGDDFNRANEDPLSKGGEWISTLCAAGPSGATPRFLRVLSNVAAGSVATTLGGSWFAEVFPGGQGEVWSTVAVAGGRTIIYNGSGCANTATVDGLAAGWTLFANGTNAGDYITVSQASTAVGDFDHVLVDTNANTRAHVRFVDVVGRSRRR
jgi:hypothetical protein